VYAYVSSQGDPTYGRLFGEDTWLFGGDTGLFCGDTGLICEDTGLFGRDIWLFDKDTGFAAIQGFVAKM